MTDSNPPAPATQGHTKEKCPGIDALNIERPNLPESASAEDVVGHLEAALMRISIHADYCECRWSGSVANVVLGRTSAARSLIASVRGGR